mgnify:CR=1 FL=1
MSDLTPVHNNGSNTVVSHVYSSAGAKVVKSLKDVPENGTVLFRAHGTKNDILLILSGIYKIDKALVELVSETCYNDKNLKIIVKEHPIMPLKKIIFALAAGKGNSNSLSGGTHSIC